MFRTLIKKEIEKIVPKGTEFTVSFSVRPEHGDYSSNVALVLAQKEGRNPGELAEEIKVKVAPRLCSGRFAICSQIEIAGPGFLNFFISKEAITEKLSSKNFLTPRARGNNLLRAARPHLKFLSESFLVVPKKINLEFVSANPTGPLTMANGRGGFYGDALANVLETVGHKVTREYYINDTGNQIKLLGESILAVEGKLPPKDEYYKGEYIKELKGKTARQSAVFLLKEIKASLKNAGIEFDVWFSEEKNLHKGGELKKVLAYLNKKNLLKEKEGALWLGENVIVKSNKEPTYFLADLAYHFNKFKKRKFELAIDIWGADHHGYIERMKFGVDALEVDPERLKILILQLVRLVSNGKEAKMSKRAGEFVTLDELLEMVGVDAARWFFLEKSLSTHMDFDLDLAKEKSKKNPVYYVQYAHARACSILKKAKVAKKADLSLLKKQEELALIKKILQLPEIVEDVAQDYQVHRLTTYVYELAQAFTKFYETQRVVDAESKEITQTRLYLVMKAKDSLSGTLNLLGISAPDKM